MGFTFFAGYSRLFKRQLTVSIFTCPEIIREQQVWPVLLRINVQSGGKHDMKEGSRWLIEGGTWRLRKTQLKTQGCASHDLDGKGGGFFKVLLSNPQGWRWLSSQHDLVFLVIFFLSSFSGFSWGFMFLVLPREEGLWSVVFRTRGFELDSAELMRAVVARRPGLTRRRCGGRSGGGSGGCAHPEP